MRASNETAVDLGAIGVSLYWRIDPHWFLMVIMIGSHMNGLFFCNATLWPTEGTITL